MALTRVSGNLIVSGVTLTSPAITGNLTLSGGTANGVTFLNGSKVLTSGSALNFDGTNFVLNNGSIRANNTSGWHTNLTATGLTNSGTTMDFDSVSSYLFKIATAEKMRLDASGNLGLGVTPSANFMLEAGSTASAAARSFKLMTLTGGFSGGNYPLFGYNFRSTATSGVYKYDASDTASAINYSGAMSFLLAPSGTAGNNITWTTAMTLAQDGNNTYVNFGCTGLEDAVQLYTAVSSTSSYFAIGTKVSGTLAERARIDTSGNFTVGGTTSYGRITGVSATGSQLATNATQSGNGVTSGIAFYNQGTGRANIYHDSTDNALYVIAASGGVKLNPTGTSWTSNSDERVKDIIEPITDAATKVSTLRTVIGKYKTDAEGTRRSFLIAQDIQAVLPEAVDASNPDNLGVQYTEVIPLLVAAIKEQTTLIESLKARLDAANL